MNPSPRKPAVGPGYLCPLGGVSGEVARRACDDGWALPLGTEGMAFTSCEIWLRAGHHTVERLTLPVPRLASWLDAQRPTLRARLKTILANLAAPTWPTGLPPHRPLIMGVVNVTPDSFSDGGRFLDARAAIAQGRRLRAEGADIVDVGGESTRPGATPVAAAEEIRRVVPVIEALATDGIAVSIDTRKASVMRAAIAAGAGMINDVSALRHDPESLAVAGASGLPVVLMHSQGEPATMQARPTYRQAALDVVDELDARLGAWRAAGFERARLLVDPGIGFGKSLEHNVEILRHLGLLLGLGVPVLLGVSRKSFVGRLAGEATAAERLPGSIAAALCGLAQGVSALRVHDVAATRQALALWRALGG